ncbi:restriction endonuclease subunit S [Aeromonas caviae]|uniref:restriction endonuclease subunit S n=1 Tax=Aeromonas caviae TaxID=648 RepID=UPI0029D8A72C|nr:restriction endonuclease subunit S [Aeromonas caviae]MDX7857915.1 restriction endonuclease subunit S [Aeromonas caviae]
MAEQMMQEAAGKTIPAGYKQTEVGVIPEEWDVATIEELADIIDPQPDHRTPPESSNGEPYIGISDFINSREVDWTASRKIISKAVDKQEKCFQLQKGDIVFGKIGTIGVPKFVPQVPFRFALSANVILLHPKNVESIYLMGFFYSEFFQKTLKSELHSTSQAAFGMNKMRLIKLPLPPKEEQTAIANVLSDSDALIDVLEQLIAKKQAIKTATMQQLLTGRTRLPQFALRPDGTPKGYKSSELGQIPEDWESVDFGNIAKPSASRINPKMSGGGDICIELEHISSGTGTLLGETTTNRTSSLKTIFEPGDVLFGKLRAYLKKYILADFYGVCSTEVWVLKPDVNLATSEYIYSIVQSERFINAASEAYGTHMPRADWSVVKYFPVMLPSTVEQTAIATILSDMDSELTALQQKLAKARSLKQGMMQQLLTGRIRLPLPKEA